MYHTRTRYKRYTYTVTITENVTKKTSEKEPTGRTHGFGEGERTGNRKPKTDQINGLLSISNDQLRNTANGGIHLQRKCLAFVGYCPET